MFHYRLIRDIFWQFFRLGLVSFGGPVAHLGYFKVRFVDELQWLSDQDYSQIVALSQFLPGPGSSQVGFAIGLLRGGKLGGIAAFLGFTLPSFLLMLAAALLAAQYMNQAWFAVLLESFKLVAVIIVAQAVYGMWLRFCTTWSLRLLAIGSAIVLMLLPGIMSQILIIICAALLVWWLLPQSIASEQINANARHYAMRRYPSALWLLLGAVIMTLALYGLAAEGSLGVLFADFFVAGGLVFGGGHVVLPLLQDVLQGQLGEDVFLLGYGFAQAVPGPMFSVGAYLGAVLWPSSPVVGALIAIVAIFLPGLLLMAGLMGYWRLLLSNPSIATAAMGINAAVVGLLLAALYDPVLRTGVTGFASVCMIVVAYWLYHRFRLSIWHLIGLMLFMSSIKHVLMG